MTHSPDPNTVPISIVISTYGREQALIDTIQSLLGLQTKAAEIIVVDQSGSHLPDVAQRLNLWHQDKAIKLITLPEPSIPVAMNTGLLNAAHGITLFTDDDIRPHEHLAQRHYECHRQSENLIVAGRVIQPWDKNQKFTDDGHQFNSMKKKQIRHFMGGNFSIDRDKAIALGGFDENFIGAAYRFEAEFAQRWLEAGYKIEFEPSAVIDHLKVATGGTRKYGGHLTTAQPYHAVGAYYYLMSTGKTGNKLQAMFERIFQSIKTRHHFKHPWYIPVTLIAEIRGLLMARRLASAGPRYINRHASGGEEVNQDR